MSTGKRSTTTSSPPISNASPRCAGEETPTERVLKRYRLTVELNRWIPVTPTQRQAVFLSYPAREVLYGGAAGGGKSVALLAAALQYANVPNYHALLLRRTFPDLNQPKGLIPLSKEWLWGTAAKYNEQAHRWHFPSGASLTFGYLDVDNDKYRYQGAEFQFIGFDELTQFTLQMYTYLFSRLRKPVGHPAPLRMRAASNPGGAGHEWVKARWAIGSKATKEEQDKAWNAGRRFVPAALEENPHLDRSEYEKALAELDPVTRAQLRRGDWEITATGVFRREWFRYWRREGNFYRLLGNGEGKLVPMDACRRFGTADLAGTEKRPADRSGDGSRDPDWSVFQVWDLTPDFDLVLVDQWRARAETPDVQEAVLRCARRHQVSYAAIEKNGLGVGLVQSLRRRGLAVRALRAATDKLTRSQTAQIRMEGGAIYFPADAPWLDDLEGELCRFPTEGAHDDQVDALSYAATEAQRMGGALAGGGDAEQREVSSAVADGRAVRLRDKPVAQAEDAELRRLLRENWEDAMWEEM